MMTVDEMIAEYMAALKKLEGRHRELSAAIQVYDKRIVLLEEEMDEIWEVIAALRKQQGELKYGRRSSGVSAAGGGRRVSSLLGLYTALPRGERRQGL